MSLLLKNSPLVTELSLFDIVNTPGVAADLSHIDTPAKTTGFTGAEQLDDALEGCDVVVIPAGVPRKPGMTRDDLFNTNASIVQSLAEGCARKCPDAAILIIANPVNSTVPIVAETMKKAGVYNPKKLFGVTTLDVVRANTFLSEAAGKQVTDVTVVGGHAGITILPLLSRTGLDLSEEQIAALTHRIQFGGDEVVQAKDGAGSATLSMAVAGARFTERVCAALAGEANVNECAFVESDIAGTGFFSSRVDIGTEGVKTIHPVGPMSDFEQANFDKMVPDLKAQVNKGIAFANKQ
jgi:malate dehydrogenase